MQKILTAICLTVILSAPLHSQSTKYTAQEVLNAVYLDESGNPPAFNTAYSMQNVLNGVYDGTSALRVKIATSTTGPYVLKAGDNMSGQLTTSSTITVQGSAFSVGGSTLVVTGGNVGIGTTGPATKLQTIGTVTVSTATTSGDSLCFVGAVTALPTTGYSRGCLLYLNSDPTKLYISTETVVGTYSWLAK